MPSVAAQMDGDAFGSRKFGQNCCCNRVRLQRLPRLPYRCDMIDI
jgi:hypothetical protein